MKSRISAFIEKLDFVYLAPALLCNVALLCGFIPAIFCLDAQYFARLSVIVFLVSIGLHVYILFQWRQYRNASPTAYAIVQPVLHMVVLVFALAVGAVDLCSPSESIPDDIVRRSIEAPSDARIEHENK